MAAPISLSLLLLTLFFQTHASISTVDPTTEQTNQLITSTDVHDLLPKFGLPRGIIPSNVNSFTLSESGDFSIELESTCYVRFDDLVYYEKHIRGKISYGAVHSVSGIQAKKFFLWLDVTGIEVDDNSGMVEFFVGSFSRKLPAKQFEEIPVCMKKASLEADIASE